MIICAAIKVKFIDADHTVKELIVGGHRHGDCLETAKYLCLNEELERVEGFINHKGIFLNRKEALNEALGCGQLPKTTQWYQKDHNIDELYSEDLY